ncbi:MAG: O-antigen ligase family protein [Novosphingobium sp.]|nr:O-antigen ligase family protein [Novosphingobium sp.]
MAAIALGGGGSAAPWPEMLLEWTADNLTGFHANRNAQADLLLIGLLALAAIVAALPRETRRNYAVPAAAIAAVLLGATILTASRAGIALLAVGLAGAAIWQARRMTARAGRRRIAAWGAAAFAGFAVLAWAAAGNRAIERVAQRFAEGEQARPELWRDTLFAIQQYWPFGSGIGTFVPVFHAAERLEVVDPSVPNRAHNDFLELALEAGLPGIVLALALAGTVVWRLVARWRNAASPDERAQVGFAAAVLALLAAHSLVDYPLRSMALASVAGVVTGMILAPRDARCRKTPPRRGEIGRK